MEVHWQRAIHRLSAVSKSQRQTEPIEVNAMKRTAQTIQFPQRRRDPIDAYVAFWLEFWTAFWLGGLPR
jgi:hypothetical protein